MRYAACWCSLQLKNQNRIGIGGVLPCVWLRRIFKHSLIFPHPQAPTGKVEPITSVDISCFLVSKCACP